MKYFICNQYVHGLAARGVHYLHRPGPILQDMGFMALPVCHLLVVKFISLKEEHLMLIYLCNWCHFCVFLGAWERQRLS